MVSKERSIKCIGLRTKTFFLKTSSGHGAFVMSALLSLIQEGVDEEQTDPFILITLSLCCISQDSVSQVSQDSSPDHVTYLLSVSSKSPTPFSSLVTLYVHTDMIIVSSSLQLPRTVVITQESRACFLSVIYFIYSVPSVNEDTSSPSSSCQTKKSNLSSKIT